MARTREENARYMREYMKTYRKECDAIRYNRGFNGCLEMLAEKGEIAPETVKKYKRRINERVDKRFKNKGENGVDNTKRK